MPDLDGGRGTRMTEGPLKANRKRSLHAAMDLPQLSTFLKMEETAL